MARADMLKKMKMPKNKADEEATVDLDNELEGMNDEEAVAPEDAVEDINLDEEAGPEEDGALKDFSDEELMAELKKRGLGDGEWDNADEENKEGEKPGEESDLDLSPEEMDVLKGLQ